MVHVSGKDEGLMEDLVIPRSPVGVATFLRFATAALLIELTPGPNMGYLAIIAAQRGRSAAFVVVAGVAVGLSFYLGLTVAWVAEGLLSNIRVYQALRWSGIAYMLWLALEAWRAVPVRITSQPPSDTSRLFARGILTNLLNVKAVIFYAVLLPSFLDPPRGRLPLQALMLGTTHVAIATAIHCGIVVTVARSRTLFPADGSRKVTRAYAVGLLVVAIWLAWSTRLGS